MKETENFNRQSEILGKGEVIKEEGKDYFSAVLLLDYCQRLPW